MTHSSEYLARIFRRLATGEPNTEDAGKSDQDSRKNAERGDNNTYT